MNRIGTFFCIVLVFTTSRWRPGADDSDVIAVDVFDYPLGPLRKADGGTGWNAAWKTARLQTAT